MDIDFNLIESIRLPLLSSFYQRNLHFWLIFQLNLYKIYLFHWPKTEKDKFRITNLSKYQWEKGQLSPKIHSPIMMGKIWTSVWLAWFNCIGFYNTPLAFVKFNKLPLDISKLSNSVRRRCFQVLFGQAKILQGETNKILDRFISCIGKVFRIQNECCWTIYCPKFFHLYHRYL